MIPQVPRPTREFLDLLAAAATAHGAETVDLYLDAYVAIVAMVQQRLEAGDLVTLPGLGGLFAQDGRVCFRPFAPLLRRAVEAPFLPDTIRPSAYWQAQQVAERKQDILKVLVDYVLSRRTP